MRYTDRLADAGIAPSVGSRGDAYDNALAESVIGLFKTEVIRRLGPWRNLEARAATGGMIFRTRGARADTAGRANGVGNWSKNGSPKERDQKKVPEARHAVVSGLRRW